MIPEPQRTYLLELLTALGTAADEFVLVGGQALKFVLAEARTTRDFDFLLDAISLREKPADIAGKLAALGYTVVPESRNFVGVEPDRISNPERRDLACRSHLVDLFFREIENLGNIVGPQGPSLLLKDLFDKHSLLLFPMPEIKNGEITIRRNEF